MRAFGPMLIALIAVFAVIYLSYVFSKYLAVGATKMSGARYMRIVDRLMLGQDKMVAIVQIGTTYYVAGVTSQNIELLKELEGEDLIEMSPTQDGTKSPFSGSFQTALSKYMVKKENK
ncbi:MAG: flagellar biosynthetic protein FliO [Eubacteriales bacterium]